jgi:hypothetical protein
VHAGADARAEAGVQPVNGSSKTASLMQLRAALDQSPSVRSQLALQRALDQRAAGKIPVKKEPAAGKPALQMKGIAINDDAGLEREADAMGARAAIIRPIQRAAFGNVIQREPTVAIDGGEPMDIGDYSIDQLQALLDEGRVWGGDYSVVSKRIELMKKWGQKDKKEEAAADTEDEKEAGGTQFPHKGKHRPPKDVIGNNKALAAKTTGGEPALYLSANPQIVIKLEADARAAGLLLYDKFTVVHRFDQTIGADQGELTPCIRIDGDHGHPIIESGAGTSFEQYIEDSIARWQADKDVGSLNRAKKYLKDIKEAALHELAETAIKAVAPAGAAASQGADVKHAGNQAKAPLKAGTSTKGGQGGSASALASTTNQGGGKGASGGKGGKGGGGGGGGAAAKAKK